MLEPKPKKLGRPKLPKGEAKGKTIQIRLAADDHKRVAVAAKASKQTVSEWSRAALVAAAIPKPRILGAR